MAERVNHGVASAVTTTGWETAKVGLAGWIAAGVIGAVSVAAVIAVPVALVGLVAGAAGLLGTSALTGAGAALASTAGAWIVGGAAVVGGIGGLSSPVGPIAGGLIGLVKGGLRVKSEKTAYNNRQEILALGTNQQQNIVAQQAFAMGVQHGQQSVVEELKNAHAQMIQAEMMKQAIANKAPVGSHTAKVCDDRNKAQTAQAQVG